MSIVSRSFAEIFDQLSPKAKTFFGELPGVRLRALHALRTAGDAGIDRSSASELSLGLDAIGIALSSVSVRNTLDAAAREGMVSRRKRKGGIDYKITQDGRRFLDEQNGPLTVVRIDAGKPLTARTTIAEVFSAQSGIVRISDPYYGVRTVHILEGLSGASDVRFLTAQVGGGETAGSVDSLMRDLARQTGTIQTRRAAKASGIPHDRFVLSATELVLIGHGLKDIGSRESFVIRLPRAWIEEIAIAVEKQFDESWNKAAPL